MDCRVPLSMVVSGSPKRWDRRHIISPCIVDFCCLSGVMSVGMLVPLKGGYIGGIVHPPIGRFFFTTYIPLIVLAEPGGLYYATGSHLLGEPETTNH